MVTYLVEKTWIGNGGNYPRQWFNKLQRVYIDRGGAKEYLRDIRRNFYQGEAIGDFLTIRFFEFAESNDFMTTWDCVDIDTMELTGDTVNVHESRIGTTSWTPADLAYSWTRRRLLGMEWPKAWHECT